MAAQPIRWLRLLAVAIPVALVSTILIQYGWQFLQRPSMIPMQASTGHMHATPFLAAGIDRPPTVAAKDAKLADGDEVVGVVVNGRPRAYRLKEMEGMFNHVVNDLIDNVPVSITYCDECDCVQVFTSSKHGEVLDIWTGGWDQQMILKSGLTFFWQNTGKLMDPNRSEEVAFPTYPFERVSWKTWRSINPKTDIFVGR